MRLKRVTQEARDMAYKAMVAALAEENRRTPLSKDDMQRRLREIQDACYGAIKRDN